MDVRVPVQQFAVGLDGGDHAGRHVVAAEQASDFRLDAGPRAGAELAEQLPVEAGMHAQAFGNGQHHLPVRDGPADLFGHVKRGQQRAFPMAGGARRALLAGEGDEHLMAAVRAADAGEALVQIAALEKGRHGVLDDRPPEAVLGLESLVVDLLEGRKALVHQAPQAGGLRIAWTVQRQGLDTRGGHGRQGSGPGIVYTLSLEPLIPSRQAGVSSLGRNCQRPHQLCRAGRSPAGLAQGGKHVNSSP